MAERSPVAARALEPKLRYGGIHRQPDRDARARGERRWWYMLRLKLPRGRLSGEQYQALDRLAERYSEALPLEAIVARVRPLLERFGDFYARRWHHRPDASALTGA